MKLSRALLVAAIVEVCLIFALIICEAVSPGHSAIAPYLILYSQFPGVVAAKALFTRLGEPTTPIYTVIDYSIIFLIQTLLFSTVLLIVGRFRK
jgi:hypothetical protein